MKTYDHVHTWAELPMEDRAVTSKTLADWHSELCIKKAFGRVWFSHCGAVYDMREFARVSRKSVRAIYYEPRSERGEHKAILIVFDGVSYAVEPSKAPLRCTDFRADREIKSRNLSLF